MAIGTPTLLAAANTSDGTKTLQSTSAFTPTVGQLIFGVCAARKSTTGTPAAILTISQTHAGSWSWDSLSLSDAQANRHTLIVGWAICPASPGSGSLQFSSNLTCNRWESVPFAISGASASITNNGTAVKTSATPNVTLTTPAGVLSVVLGILASVGDTTGVTPGAGFTELVDSSPGTLTTLAVEYAMPAAGSSPAWADCNTTSNLLIVLEVPVTPTAAALGQIRRRRRQYGASKDARFLRR